MLAPLPRRGPPRSPHGRYPNDHCELIPSVKGLLARPGGRSYGGAYGSCCSTSRGGRRTRAGRGCGREGHHPPLRRGRHRRRRAARRLAGGPAGQADRRDGPVGLGQVNPDAHHGRARPADERRDLDRGNEARRTERQRDHEAAPRAHRLRLPVLQPAADADRRGEHRPPAHDRGREARESVARGAVEEGRPRRPQGRTAPRSSPAASSSAWQWRGR